MDETTETQLEMDPMKKIDIDATMAKIRQAMEASAAMPGQDAAELACNRDGIDAALAFARWALEQKAALSADDYCDAVGMLVGSFVVGSLSAIEPESHQDALGSIFEQLTMSVNRHIAGILVDGDATIKAVTRDVGDA